jgi:Cu/Ag efflux protein CusF
MTTKTISAMLTVLALAGAPALALAQAPKGPQVNCGAQGAAPQQVEGQVVKVDAASGTITVKAKDGTTHEFKASKETIADMKPGDQIEARLRAAQNCS